MVGEALCAVSASLAASECYGEQECADLWRHAGKEYAAKARSEAAKGIWPVKGDSVEYLALEESIFYRAEQEPTGKLVWDRWQEIKKEVANVILPLLKQILRKDAEKHSSEEHEEPSFTLYSGTNWREVVEQVRADYHKHKTRGKNAGQPPKGWTTPAFAAFVQFGPPAVADGRDCIPAFRLVAGARKRKSHDPAQGRVAVRAEAKKNKKAEEVEGGLAGAPTQLAPQCSPTTRLLLGELGGKRTAVQYVVARSSIQSMLEYVTDPASRAVLVKQLMSTCEAGVALVSPASTSTTSAVSSGGEGCSTSVGAPDEDTSLE